MIVTTASAGRRTPAMGEAYKAMVGMDQLVAWINQNLGIALTATGAFGAVVGFFARNFASWFLETRREGRAAKADQKRAAIEFAHIVNEYRSHWIKHASRLILAWC